MNVHGKQGTPTAKSRGYLPRMAGDKAITGGVLVYVYLLPTTLLAADLSFLRSTLLFRSLRGLGVLRYHKHSIPRLTNIPTPAIRLFVRHSHHDAPHGKAFVSGGAAIYPFSGPSTIGMHAYPPSDHRANPSNLKDLVSTRCPASGRREPKLRHRRPIH